MATLTAAILRGLWPRAPQKKIDAIVNIAPTVFAKYRINTPLRLAHFMAQLSHECMAGTITRENMSYSAGRMMQIFGVGRHSAKITQEEAPMLAHNPQALAERVYGLGNPKKAKELGNTQKGDGFKYRGNGDLQLTGRGSHARVGKRTGFDLENKPELLENAAVSFEVAAAEFVALQCLPAADADDVGLVTRRVNGGTNGLAERTVWLRRWKTCLDGIEEPPAAPRGAEPEAAPTNFVDTNLQRAAIAGPVATGILSAFTDWKIVLAIGVLLLVSAVTLLILRKKGYFA